MKKIYIVRNIANEMAGVFSNENAAHKCAAFYTNHYNGEKWFVAEIIVSEDFNPYDYFGNDDLV